MGTNLSKLVANLQFKCSRYILHFVKRIGFNIIVGKYIYGTNLILYYPKWEHLVFLFKKTLDYEKHIQNYIKGFINKNDLIFDLGANIGQYSLYFSHLVSNKNGKIISVEPDPNSFGLLCLNKYKNQCPNLHLLNIGISNKFEILTLEQDLITGGRTSNFLNKTQSVIKVEMQPLSWLINKYGIPDFIKIDVEGFEVKVLQGIDDVNIFKNIKILIEVRAETKEYCFKKLIGTHKCFLLEKKSIIQIFHFQNIPDFANLFFIPSNL